MNKDFSKVLVIITIIVLIGVPLLFLQGKIFTGTDDRALQVIAETAPTYKPWLSSFWKPQGDNEALIFTLQAASGSFILGYILGLLKGRKNTKPTEDKNV